jgi:hypothetical protein
LNNGYAVWCAAGVVCGIGVERFVCEGRPGEAAALRAGKQTYDIYINLWQAKDGERVVEFITLDVHKKRRETPAWERDGSMSMAESFYAISAEYLLKNGFAIKAKFYNRVRRSEFMGEILQREWPRELLEM